MRQDVLVMENLFYDRKIDKVFDTLNMATPPLNGEGGGGGGQGGHETEQRQTRALSVDWTVA